MSSTCTPLPIVSALYITEDKLGGGNPWEAVSQGQRFFLESIHAKCTRESIDIPEMVAEATVTRNGDIITIDARSKLDVTVKWFEKGDKQEIESEDPENPEKKRMYPGVRIKSKHVSFSRSREHPHPIARLDTKNGDQVFMTMVDVPLADFGIYAFIRSLELRPTYREFGGLRFPMTKFKENPDITFLEGMKNTSKEGYPAVIVQAWQETKFRMNEVGARAESEVRLRTMVYGSAGFDPVPPDHVIDKPFVVWIVREGLPLPLFMGYITREHWENPGELSADYKD